MPYLLIIFNSDGTHTFKGKDGNAFTVSGYGCYPPEWWIKKYAL